MRLSLFAILLAVPFLAAASVPEPDGFRMDDYNAPVPVALAGAQVVDAQALAAAMANGDHHCRRDAGLAPPGHTAR